MDSCFLLFALISVALCVCVRALACALMICAWLKYLITLHHVKLTAAVILLTFIRPSISVGLSETDRRTPLCHIHIGSV